MYGNHLPEEDLDVRLTRENKYASDKTLILENDTQLAEANKARLRNNSPLEEDIYLNDTNKCLSDDDICKHATYRSFTTSDRNSYDPEYRKAIVDYLRKRRTGTCPDSMLSQIYAHQSSGGSRKQKLIKKYKSKSRRNSKGGRSRRVKKHSRSFRRRSGRF
jgi:hypothetical protein